MATEFKDDLHYMLFKGQGPLRTGNSYEVRGSELTLAALRAAGLLNRMVDDTVPPAIDRLWLDKNSDPAILKEWDSIGSAWMPMTFERIFERAAISVLTVTGGTANNIIASQPSVFIPNRLYSVTPNLSSTGAVTITVTGVGVFPATYVGGAALNDGEFSTGRPSLLIFRNGRFEVLFGYSLLTDVSEAVEAALDAAERAENAAATVNLPAMSAANAGGVPAVNAAGTGYDIADIVQLVSTRAALKAMAIRTRATGFYLTETDRQGAFIRKTGSPPVSDPTEGRYIVSDTAGYYYERVFDGPFYARWCGSGQAAIEAAHALADEIVIDRSFAVTANATWPKGKRYLFLGDGQLSVPSGVTLTIRGTVDAGVWRGLPTSSPRKIFNQSGTGKIVGLRYVIPEWWGAVGNGVADDRSALQAAHDCAELSLASDGPRPTIELYAPNYFVGATFHMFPSADFGFELKARGVIFSGTRVKPLGNISGPVIHVHGNDDATQKIVDFCIRDVGVEKGDGSAPAGLQIGDADANLNLIGLQASLLENVFIGGFAVALDLVNVRQLDIRRLSVWNGAVDSANSCVRFRAVGSFTGDMVFSHCQFVTTLGSGRVVIDIDSSGGVWSPGVNHIAGINFNDCDFYSAHTKVKINASAGSQISDIWFVGCQWDGNSNRDLQMQSSGSGSLIRDIQVKSSFLLGGNISISDPQIEAAEVSGGKIMDVQIADNFIGNAIGTTINLFGTTGVKVCDNTFADVNYTTGPVVYANNAKRFRVCDNDMTRNGPAFTASMVQTAGACDFYHIKDNTAAGIVSGSTVIDGQSPVTANKSVSGNI